MKGEKTTITKLLKIEESFSIPVYQRDYSWKKEQCRQLYDDLISMIINHRPNHFFGSIVDAENPIGGKHEYIIIDGQQRITTVSLLLLALRKLIQEESLNPGKSTNEVLLRKINNTLINEEDEIRLKPAPNCRDAYQLLFTSAADEYISSNITDNYTYFLNRLIEDKENYAADQIWDAIDSLNIIEIYLQAGDDAQLIFESINSTGLGLSESDKIRNYLMMSLELKEQERYYNEYWKKIEANTEDRTDFFVRDFLTIHTHTTPNREHIYDAFKAYSRNMNNEQIIKSMLKFSKYYHQFYHPEDAPDKFHLPLLYLNRLEVSVADSYLMQLFEGNEAGTIPENEVIEALEVIEDYVFRRRVCGIPTNSMNKTFSTLHTDALKLKGNTDDYSERIAYTLMKRDGTARFPRNDEFLRELAERDIYTTMSERNKFYLLERLENFDNNESHDIYALVSAGKCSIEHIMPQTLNEEWRNDLGPEAETIHKTWLHKLANLTFTGYNSKYSNQPFSTKQSMEHGFKDSTFSLNKFIASKTKWGESELKERQTLLLEKATKIWQDPHSIFIEDKVDDSGFVNLAENYNFSGKQIKGFTFEKTAYTVNSWKDFIILFAQLLYEKDKSIMQELSRTTASFGPSNFIFASEHDYAAWQVSEVKDGIYIWTSSSTWDKLRLVKSLLDCYGLPYTTIEINVRNVDEEIIDLHELSFRFWTALLPKLNEKTDLFAEKTLMRDRWLFAPAKLIPGMFYRIVFNSRECRIAFEFSMPDDDLNFRYFDFAYAHKDQIEDKVGEKLDWNRNEFVNGSAIKCYAKNCRLKTESSWDKAISFICEKLPKLHDALQPVLEQYRSIEMKDAVIDDFDEAEDDDEE